jgi:hypothetical protein
MGWDIVVGRCELMGCGRVGPSTARASTAPRWLHNNFHPLDGRHHHETFRSLLAQAPHQSPDGRVLLAMAAVFNRFLAVIVLVCCSFTDVTAQIYGTGLIASHFPLDGLQVAVYDFRT